MLKWMRNSWVTTLVVAGVVGCGPANTEVQPQGDSASTGGTGPTTTSNSSPTSMSSSSDSSVTGNSQSTTASTTGSSTSAGQTTNESTTGDPTGATTSETSASTGVSSGCTLPVLVHDPFGNGDPATGGPAATNGGVTYADNGSDNGTLTEMNGAVRITTPANSTGTTPNVGFQSNGSFDGTTAQGVTVVMIVQSTDPPLYQGITLALHSDPGHYEFVGEPGIELHVFGGTTGGGDPTDNVVLRGDDAGEHDYSQAPYNAAMLADGYTAVLSARPSGWTLRVDGLTDPDTPIVDEGSWVTDFDYNDLLDSESYIGVSIQALNNEQTGRVLDVASLTLFDGVCDENVIPDLP